MDSVLTDPYEQKLYHMFSTHGVDGQGSIDVEALKRLCKSLELKETGTKIIRALVKTGDDSSVRITFKAFKEELLHVLGTEIDTIGHSNQAKHHEVENSENKGDSPSQTPTKPSRRKHKSPSREVSPKLVMGSKKYGRRTRPQLSSDISESESESESTLEEVEVQKGLLNKVHRSASQSDVKRRRAPKKGSKLKRCASLPAQRNMERAFVVTTRGSSPHKLKSQLDSSLESLGDLDLEHLTQDLYEVWIALCSELHANSNELRDRDELELVFGRVGIVPKVAKSLAEEVYEKLGYVDPNLPINFQQFIALIQSDDNMLYLTNNCTNLRSITKEDTNHVVVDKEAGRKDQQDNNIVSSEVIIEMWETVGVINAVQLLKQDLAFDTEEINIAQLSAAIDEELNGLQNDCREDEQVGMNLMRASLALHKAEVNGLQVALKQLADENQKLYTSNRDSNDRVALLAQEVDERHATIENSTKQEIRAVEQKHADNVREITVQMELDREQWTAINGKLESRIKQLEQEEGRLKTETNRVEDRNCALETEQMTLQKQMAELLETNIKLNNEICDLEERYKNQQYSRGDRENEEIMDLIEKITSLQTENSDLRDRNDELCAEIDGIASELNLLKIKKINSITKQSIESGESETEQIANSLSSSLSIGMATKRRGDSPSKTIISEESPRLGKVRKRSTDNSASDSETNNGDWMALNTELEATHNHARSSQITEDFVQTLKDKIAELETRLNCDKSVKREEEKTSNEESPIKCLQCQELESSLELMRKEFEGLEDYWQTKLNEERQLFEDEQRGNDDKFNDLLQKMLEYEEQFASTIKKEEDECDKRLSPIDEKDFLEQQYLEIEFELDELKAKHKKMAKDKNEEIRSLRNEIKKMQQTQMPSQNNPSSIERTSTPESPANSPISYLWNQSTIYGPARDYHNPNWTAASKQTELPSTVNSEDTPQITTLYGLSTTATTTWTSSNTEKTLSADVDEPPIVISPIQKPKPSGTKSVDDNNCDRLSTTSSVGHHSTTSTYNVIKPGSMIDNEQFPVDPMSSPMPEIAIAELDLNATAEELKRLKVFETQLQEECKELAHKKEALINELQQLNDIRPVLEKTYARAIHPNLTTRINQLEQKNRHLQTVIRQQLHYSDSIMHQTWQQQRVEIGDLRNRLETQSITIADQAQRLAKADILVKELFVENSHLRANIQRLEQQTMRNSYMFQHQAQGPQSGMNGVPGFP